MNNLNHAAFICLQNSLPSMKAFCYTNNIISYKNKNIILGNFDLQEFLHANGFGLEKFNSNELFDLLKLHADIINCVSLPVVESNKINMMDPVIIVGTNPASCRIDLISMDRFISLINKKSTLTEIELKEIDKSFSLIEELLFYQDYLTPQVKTVLNQYQKILSDLENGKSQDPISEFFFNKYNLIQNKALEKVQTFLFGKEEVIPKTENAGFSKALSLAFLVAFLGVIIALILFINSLV